MLYYISYIVDAGQPMEAFSIIDATSIGNAYRLLCAKEQTSLFHNDSPTSDEEAYDEIRTGKFCSVTVCFSLPAIMQTTNSEQATKDFDGMSYELFAQCFISSTEKIVRTGISKQYLEPLKSIFSKAERPFPSLSAMNRRFERTFLPNSWFNERTGP